MSIFRNLRFTACPSLLNNATFFYTNIVKSRNKESYERENKEILYVIPVKVKVKLYLYRPWRPLGLREVEAPTFSDIRLINGG
jgi:hypothetical protein